MSKLRPESLAILATARRAVGPLFSNMITAEIFEATHTRGPLHVLPVVGGGFAVHDERRPLGQGAVATGLRTVEQAHAELLRLANEGDQT